MIKQEPKLPADTCSCMGSKRPDSRCPCQQANMCECEQPEPRSWRNGRCKMCNLPVRQSSFHGSDAATTAFLNREQRLATPTYTAEVTLEQKRIAENAIRQHEVQSCSDESPCWALDCTDCVPRERDALPEQSSHVLLKCIEDLTDHARSMEVVIDAVRAHRDMEKRDAVSLHEADKALYGALKNLENGASND